MTEDLPRLLATPERCWVACEHGDNPHKPQLCLACYTKWVAESMAKEREVCAQIADNWEPRESHQGGYEWDCTCEQIAEAIRARK